MMNDVSEQDDESPELLEGIDAGLGSLEQKGARPTTREAPSEKARRRAGESR